MAELPSQADNKTGPNQKKELSPPEREQLNKRDETAAAGSDQVHAKPYCGLKDLPDQVDYLNAIVQLLYHNDIFRGYVRQHLPLGVMHSSLCKLFYQMDAMASTSADDVHSTLLKLEPQFHKNAKYEAQQLFVALVGMLQREANQMNKQRDIEQNVTPMESNSASHAWDNYCESVNKSDLATLMTAQMETSLACLACGLQSPSWTVLCPVQVNFPQNDTSIYRSTLKSFLENQSAKQTLNADCVKCEKVQQWSKRSFISRYPPLLVFHLARVSPSSSDGKVNRKLVMINECIQLDDDHSYYLTSAVLMNKTTEAGTVYWTLVRDSAQEKWTSLEGDVVKEIALCDAKQQLDSFGYLFAFTQVPKTDEIEKSKSPPDESGDDEDGSADRDESSTADDDDDDGHSTTDDDKQDTDKTEAAANQ